MRHAKNADPERQINRLTRKDYRRLEDWLLSNWHRFETAFPGYVALAKVAGEALHFAVTAQNVKGAIEAVELKVVETPNVLGGRKKFKYRPVLRTIVEELVFILDELGVDDKQSDGRYSKLVALKASLAAESPNGNGRH